jgi:hypothetical protein
MRLFMPALLGTTMLLAASALAAETKTGEAPAAPAADVISCGAPIAWDATEESLKAQFGAENVVHMDLGGPEGTEMFGTRIFTKDPTKTFDVVWFDDKTWSKPVVINVNQVWSEDGETVTKPTWKSPEGIYVGMPIEEVEKINGKPFKLYGFGWDYGGTPTSFEGGKLEPAADATCGTSMVFTDGGESTPESVLGEGEIMSNGKDTLKAKPTVGRFTVYYVRPDAEAPATETP